MDLPDDTEDFEDILRDVEAAKTREATAKAAAHQAAQSASKPWWTNAATSSTVDSILATSTIPRATTVRFSQAPGVTTIPEDAVVPPKPRAPMDVLGETISGLNAQFKKTREELANASNGNMDVQVLESLEALEASVEDSVSGLENLRATVGVLAQTVGELRAEIGEVRAEISELVTQMVCAASAMCAPAPAAASAPAVASAPAPAPAAAPVPVTAAASPTTPGEFPIIGGEPDSTTATTLWGPTVPWPPVAPSSLLPSEPPGVETGPPSPSTPSALIPFALYAASYAPSAAQQSAPDTF